MFVVFAPIALAFLIVATPPADQSTSAHQMGFVANLVSGNWLLVRTGTSRTTPQAAHELNPLFAGDRLELRQGNGTIRVALFNGELRTLTAKDQPFIVPDTRGSGFLAWLSTIANRQRQWFSTVSKSGESSLGEDGIAVPVNAARTEFRIPGRSTEMSATRVSIVSLDREGQRADDITTGAELDARTGTLRMPIGTSLPSGLFELRRLVPRSVGPRTVYEPRDAATWVLAPNATDVKAMSEPYAEAERLAKAWRAAGAEVEAQRLLRARLVASAFPSDK